MKSGGILQVLQISLMSELIEDSWVFITAFRIFQYKYLKKIESHTEYVVSYFAECSLTCV